MNKAFILFAVDMLIAIIAVYGGYLVSFGSTEPYDNGQSQRAGIFCAVAVISSYLLELYNVGRQMQKKVLFSRIFLSVIASFLAAPLVGYVIDVSFFLRGILLGTLVIFGALHSIWHVSYRSFMNSKGMARKVLVLGTGPLAKTIGDLIQSGKQRHVLEGYINPTGESVMVPSENVRDNGHGLPDTVKKNNVHKLVVSLSERRGIFPVQDVMYCKFRGIEVIDAPTFYEEITEKLLIENTTPSWFIFSNGFRMTASMKFYKRTFDILCSFIGLAVTVPLLPFIALLIKCDSRGPVFFKQVRIGELDKPFILYKFRTMRQDAEKGTGAVWAQKHDPRVTRVGRILRKIRLDELPQLLNVLRGDMSFIGPRPERPEFVAELKKIIPYYSQRHLVMPGVTGWAQIRYPYGASVEDAIEKLRYDLYYIKNISLLLDMQIMFETVKVVLFGKGSR